ncbi:hypothetical protein IWW55_001917, partial [Coemansia sp. RSA 2706]
GTAAVSGSAALWLNAAKSGTAAVRYRGSTRLRAAPHGCERLHAAVSGNAAPRGCVQLCGNAVPWLYAAERGFTVMRLRAAVRLNAALRLCGTAAQHGTAAISGTMATRLCG